MARLARLFRGLPRAHGVYDLSRAKQGETKKVEGSARTVREPVSTQLWEAHVEGRQGLGIVPINDEGVSYFGAIDVDQYDINIADVEARCAILRLPLIPTRTKSGGIHLYCFTGLGVPARLLRSRLTEWAVALGVGGSEIFPKQNALLDESDVGNWINMPYFNAQETERYGVSNGAKQSLIEYVDYAEDRQVTEDYLLTAVLPENPDFMQGPPCLQTLAGRGFGSGSRNKGLFAIGVYLKKRFPNDEEWAGQLRIYNTKFMKPALEEAELKTIIKSLGRKEYNFACSQDPIKSFCNRTLCRTRDFGIGKADTKDWGITIDSEAQIIMTEPPYWVLTVNGTRMRFFSEDLMKQPRFQELCMQKIRFLPPTLPRDEWTVNINKIISTATEIEAPSDSGPEGELRWYLHQFCTVYPQAETREEMLTGKPWIDTGYIFFRGNDFKRYLEAQHFRALTGNKLYAAMRDFGVEHQQLWITNQNILVWKIAVAETTKDIPMPVRQVDKGSM